MKAYNLEEKVFVADKKTNQVYEGVINLIVDNYYNVFIPKLKMSFKFLANELHRTYQEAQENPL